MKPPAHPSFLMYFFYVMCTLSERSETNPRRNPERDLMNRQGFYLVSWNVSETFLSFILESFNCWLLHRITIIVSTFKLKMFLLERRSCMLKSGKQTRKQLDPWNDFTGTFKYLKPYYWPTYVIQKWVEK